MVTKNMPVLLIYLYFLLSTSVSSFVFLDGRHSSLVVRFGRASETPEIEGVDALPATEEKTRLEANTTLESKTNFSSASVPDARQLMAAMGTSPRRIALSLLAGTGIALTGNLFGVTSALLAKFPEDSVASTGLDTYFPRGDFKRFIGKSYEFVIPKDWVADTNLELLKAQRRTAALDLSMPKSQQQKILSMSLPDAAFGPAGNMQRGKAAGDTNVSVLVSQLTSAEAATLQGLLEKDANSFLQAFFGQGRTLERLEPRLSGSSAYDVTELQYGVDRGSQRLPLRAISVIALNGQYELITLTVVAPMSDWESGGPKLRKIADSFKLR